MVKTYRERLTNWIIGTFESIEDVVFKNQDAFVLVLLFDLKSNVFEEYFVISFVYKAYNIIEINGCHGRNITEGSLSELLNKVESVGNFECFFHVCWCGG